MGTLLNIAYKSQHDLDAAESRNDCGPACLAMLLNALGVAVTTDGVFQRTGAPADGYLSTAQLRRVSESYGAPLEYHPGWGLGDLRSMLIPEPTLAGDRPGQPAPRGLTASPQLGGPIKH